MQLLIDGRQSKPNDIETIVAMVPDSPIAVETTTLGFVEVLYCCNAMFGRDAPLECIYVEPGDYRRSREADILRKRDFELSNEIVGFRGIPGAAKMLNDRVLQKYVFFLGYEGSRFRRAFTDLEMLQGDKSNVVFGVPAFLPGWEMDSFANNIPVIRDEYIHSVHFCGADNPQAAFEILLKTYEGLQSNESMFVAPLGTKPHGLATALFATTQKEIGVIYDHPRRSPDRSVEVGDWHVFTIDGFN